MIPQIEPWIDEKELEYLKKMVSSTFVTEHALTLEFEDRIKKLTGAKHAIAMANGTLALSACQMALGIKPGDEVIVPDLTFIASANSSVLIGAKPVFCDIEAESMCIDQARIEGLITDKTKAIMPVHLYGLAADMEKILEIARKHNLAVLEDAAQGIGVKYKGKHVGTFGELGIISFYGNKTITTGEGAVVLTDNSELAAKCYRLKNHGRSKKGVFIHEDIGFNFSFTEMQAAIGLAQLDKLPEIIRRKEAIRRRYEKELSGIKEIRFQEIPRHASPVFWFTNIYMEDVTEFEQFMKSNDIGTRRYFYPLHLQPCYKGWASGSYPEAEKAYKTGISLPSSATLKEKEQKIVIEKIKEFFRK